MNKSLYGYNTIYAKPNFASRKKKAVSLKTRFDIKFMYLLTRIDADHISYMILWKQENEKEYSKLVGYIEINELTFFEWNILVDHINSQTYLNTLNHETRYQ